MYNTFLHLTVHCIRKIVWYVFHCPEHVDLVLSLYSFKNIQQSNKSSTFTVSITTYKKTANVDVIY